MKNVYLITFPVEYYAYVVADTPETALAKLRAKGSKERVFQTMNLEIPEDAYHVEFHSVNYPE